jgi:hypothetical protein
MGDYERPVSPLHPLRMLFATDSSLAIGLMCRGVAGCFVRISLELKAGQGSFGNSGRLGSHQTKLG